MEKKEHIAEVMAKIKAGEEAFLSAPEIRIAALLFPDNIKPIVKLLLAMAYNRGSENALETVAEIIAKTKKEMH